MCEHCRSVGGNRRKIEDQERVKVLCKSARRGNENNEKIHASGCCEWRRSCCGGGCCEATNCCGTGSSGLNVGYNNMSNKIVPMGTGMEINYSWRKHGTEMRNGGHEMINGETVLCGSEKFKYCSGGECRLNEPETRSNGENDVEKSGENGETSG